MVGRDATVDVARGLAIVAIVAGHVWRGLVGSDIIPNDRTYVLVDSGLYFFHLAVFVFISGLFVPGGVRRRGPKRYVRSRLVLFLYLYLVWSMLQGAVKMASGSLSNSPLGLRELFALWIPQGQLWFLPFMAVMTVLVVAYRPWEGRWGWISVGIVAASSLAAWGVEGAWIGTRGLSLTVFFFLGAALGARRVLPWLGRLRPIPAVALGASTLGGFLVLLVTTPAQTPTIVDGHRTLGEVVLGVLATILGSVALLAVAALIPRVPGLGDATAFLGRRSMEIFLAHIIVASATRILLVRLGVGNVSVHVIVGTALGVVAPLSLWWLTGRVRWLQWLFRAPNLGNPGRQGDRSLRGGSSTTAG